jgi:type IV secretion system protein VirD4
MSTQKKITKTNVICTFAASGVVGFAAAHMGQATLESGLSFPECFYFGFNDMLRHIADTPFDLTANDLVLTMFLMGFLVPWICWWWYLKNTGNYRPGEEHGSARWMTDDEMREYGDEKDPDNNVILSQHARMVFEPKGFNLEHDRNKNVLILGGPGSGKTRYVIKPNLMQLNSSVWVSDPKGTIPPEVGHLFEDNGYDIRVFNTMDFSKSMHFNPFAYIRSDEDIPKIVNCIIKNVKPKDAGKSGDPFWEQSESSLITALVAYMHEALDPSQCTFRTLNKLLGMIEVEESNENHQSPLDILMEAWKTGKMPAPAPQRGAGRGPVLMHRTQDSEPIDPATVRGGEYIRTGEAHPNSYAVREYGKFKVGAGKTLKSILMSVNADLWQFDLEDVLSLTDYDEMDLDSIGGLCNEDLIERAKIDPGILEPGGGTPCGKCAAAPNGQRKVAMFVIMDDQDSTFAFLIATLTWLGISRLKNYADDHGGKLPIPVQFYLDEFANIGKISDFQQVITTIRSRKMATTLVLQSLAQLDSVYGKDEAGIIKDACDTWIYLGGSGNDTCEYLSKKMGNETVNNRNNSKTYSQQRSSSTSEQILQRALMDPSEVAKMPRRNCLVLINGSQPYKDQKYQLEDHPRYAYIDPGHHAGKRPGARGKSWPDALYDDMFDVTEFKRKRDNARKLERLIALSKSTKRYDASTTPGILGMENQFLGAIAGRAGKELSESNVAKGDLKRSATAATSYL